MFFTQIWLGEFFSSAHSVGTVYPVVANLVSKVARDLKLKSQKNSWRELFTFQNYREKCRGGAKKSPPPPPPNGNRVKPSFWQREQQFLYNYTKSACTVIFHRKSVICFVYTVLNYPIVIYKVVPFSFKHAFYKKYVKFFGINIIISTNVLYFPFYPLL